MTAYGVSGISIAEEAASRQTGLVNESQAAGNN
jgi:hypothetical protein